MIGQKKLVILISVLASFVVFLDGSVVNVALPAIENSLGGGLPLQQWVVNAYLLTLGSLILTAGSISDLFGRKRVILIGLLGFGVASLLCAVAPSSIFLVASRALQGVFGALLVPSSLALIISTFSGKEQGKAIGTWTAWTGISFLIGPLLGGFLVDAGSWRLVFAINVVPIFFTLLLLRKLQGSTKNRRDNRVDYIGALLCSSGLGLSVYALIEQTNRGIKDPLIIGTFLLGIVLLGLFVLYERRASNPMLPLSLFKVRNFTVGNLATIAIYSGLSVATFLIVIFVQQVGGYTALQAGLSLVPVTIIMFLLSTRFGELAGQYGPRLFMSIGPLICSFGFLYLLRVDQSVNYWTQIFPGIVIFGLGLSITVAPLTSAVLSDIKEEFAGIGSAVNNAVARIAGLLATAAIGLLVGTNLQLIGFRRGVVAMSLLLFLGAIISAIGIQNKIKKNPKQSSVSG